MNIFSKVLVVFIFVLSVAFAASQMILHAKRVQYQKLYDDTKTKLEEQTRLAADLLTQLNDLRREADMTKNTLSAQVAALETEGKNKDGRIQDLTIEKTKLDAGLNQAVASVNSLVKEIRDKDVVIGELTAKSNGLAADLNAALQKGAELDKELTARKKDIESLNEQLAQLGQEKKQVAEENERLSGVLASLERRGVHVVWDVVPVVDAKVVRVANELRTVVLNKGSKDGVKVAFPFTVYRGSEFVAQVAVVEVQDNFCLARAEPGMFIKPMQVGDDATTRMQ